MAIRQQRWVNLLRHLNSSSPQLTLLGVSEPPKQQRRFLGVLLKNLAFFLTLYAALFLALNNQTYHGVRKFYSIPAGQAAFVALVVVFAIGVYARIGRR